MSSGDELSSKEQNWFSKMWAMLKDLFWDDDSNADGSPPEDHYPLF